MYTNPVHIYVLKVKNRNTRTGVGPIFASRKFYEDTILKRRSDNWKSINLFSVVK